MPFDSSSSYCLIITLAFGLTKAFSICAQEDADISGSQMKVTKSGLQYQILDRGAGPLASEGDTVWIFESTEYRNGEIIYSNMDSNTPVRVVIGAGQATKGMDEGLRGMQAGELRRLVLSPELARREYYPDNLSPDSSLIITVRLHRIESGG